MDEILVKAFKWVARGVGLALDLTNLHAGFEHLRRDARKNRR
ncbi:hypothetical protein ACFCV8_02175 [Streptomyces sp. NPDC056347]